MSSNDNSNSEDHTLDEDAGDREDRQGREERKASDDKKSSDDQRPGEGKEPSEDDEVLTSVLDQLVEDTDDEKVTVNDVVSAFESRGFGALCTVVGLVAALPLIGAIPGMSIITGSLIFVIAIQFVVGRQQPWIPGIIGAREISADKLEKAAEKARPYTQWVDKFVKPRLKWLVAGAVQQRIIAILICVLAITMWPLALVPWGVQPPATAIVLFGVAILGRDGAFAAAGYALVGVTIYVIYYFWGTLVSGMSWLFGG